MDDITYLEKRIEELERRLTELEKRELQRSEARDHAQRQEHRGIGSSFYAPG